MAHLSSHGGGALRQACQAVPIVSSVLGHYTSEPTKCHITVHFKFLLLRRLPWTDDVEETWYTDSRPFTTAACIASDSDKSSRFSSSSVPSFGQASQHPPKESDEEFASSEVVDDNVVATSNSETR
jgi:hypothetical protein